MAGKNGTAQFVLSAGKLDEFPSQAVDEFAICGRSNVGKSSFINHLFGDNSLARTSKRPGTTLCANFYKTDDRYFLVDLPGYGFARTSESEKTRWSNLIKDYCERRTNCKGVIWLVDIRHVDQANDAEAYEWFLSLGLRVLPVLTKADKLSRNQQINSIRHFKKNYNSAADPVLYSIHDQDLRALFQERFTIFRNAQ